MEAVLSPPSDAILPHLPALCFEEIDPQHYDKVSFPSLSASSMPDESRSRFVLKWHVIFSPCGAQVYATRNAHKVGWFFYSVIYQNYR